MAELTIPWDETTPADSDERKQGCVEITNLKTQFREMFEVDHEIESSGSGANWGKHNKVTFYNADETDQNYLPDAIENTIILFTRWVYAYNGSTRRPEIFFIDEDSNEQQLTCDGQFVGGIVGEIRLFYGVLTLIPDGWKLCDGSPGTPNLLGKFIKGTTSATANAGYIDGVNSQHISATHLPSHTHTIPISGAHTHEVYGQTAGIASGLGPLPRMHINSAISWYTGSPVVSGGEHRHILGYTGSGDSFNNRPLYFELAYMIKT